MYGKEFLTKIKSYIDCKISTVSTTVDNLINEKCSGIDAQIDAKIAELSLLKPEDVSALIQAEIAGLSLLKPEDVSEMIESRVSEIDLVQGPQGLQGEPVNIDCYENMVRAVYSDREVCFTSSPERHTDTAQRIVLDKNNYATATDGLGEITFTPVEACAGSFLYSYSMNVNGSNSLEGSYGLVFQRSLDGGASWEDLEGIIPVHGREFTATLSGSAPLASPLKVRVARIDNGQIIEGSVILSQITLSSDVPRMICCPCVPET